ncbi:MAG TPA: plastocyanin/azurin family copper-binding protein [Acidimicrobiales bacterium]|nr:plastocyanin/azurin family copper-binding protein [Acidimicrobiales bacterium]
MRKVLWLPLLLLVACGGGDGERGVATPERTVDIEMRDIAFAPDAVSVPRGATVRFRFHNVGRLTHDAFLGDAAAQKNHERDMGHGGHDMGDAVTVKPGASDDLVHRFDKAGELVIGCHEPGHYGAGMRLTVTVT